MSFDTERKSRRHLEPAAPPAADDVRLQLNGGRIVGVSAGLQALLGWRPEDWISHGVEDFLHPEGLAGMDLHLSGIAPGQRLLWRDRLRSRDGGWHWVQLEVTPAPRAGTDAGGGAAPARAPAIAAAAAGVDAERDVAAGGDAVGADAVGVDGVGVDAVARLQLLREGDDISSAEERRRLRCDDLTDLLNRREVLGRIESLQTQERRHGEAVAILFCDLDGFKGVNDRFGHGCGDEVLRQVAGRLRSRLRISDLAARIGGDELLVVLDGVHDLSDAREIADALRRAVAQPLELGEGRGTIIPTLSIGVTLARPGEGTHQLLERADQAMYLAKRNGRNQVMTIGA